MSAVSERYRLAEVIALICKYHFTRVVLQFPDEELQYSFDVHNVLLRSLPEDVDLYITADSTWGSSIDDVSAMHCDADVLIYFGTDLSSSGSMPVILCPPVRPFSVDRCAELLSTELSALYTGTSRDVAIFYEPGCAAGCGELVAGGFGQGKCQVFLAKLPLQADLENWEPSVKGKKNEAHDPRGSEMRGDDALVGGLYIPSEIISNKETVMVYIGDKVEQIVNILLRASENTVIHFSPTNDSTQPVRVLKGTESIEFRERYGGVLRVKDARIIGIIVGSMGLTAELTKDIVHRLQVLIRAAHKRYYCFVMGRLNEAKLCNFPEVINFFTHSSPQIACDASKRNNLCVYDNVCLGGHLLPGFE